MYRWLNTGFLINKLLLTIIVCTPGLTNGDDYLPTIFWDPKSPA